LADPPDRLSAALADRYAIERELGAGGMATVYLAEDLRHHRKVALKVLRAELAAVLGGERFHREIQIAAQLQHPNILPLLDSGEAAGLLFYAMPYVEGQSLRERLAREGALPMSDTVRILRDVVDALTEAHAHGVVHRDIKPENIMLRGRHALVTDFGVAKAVSEATGRQTLTTAGVALGTPAYMAPEQASADPHLDHRVDLYAVGAVAYELLTGRPVFMGTTPQMVLSAHVTEAPVPITNYRETVPRALEALVLRCLEKRPADRWQSAEELLPQLEALAGIVALIAIGALASQLLRPKPLAITAGDITQVTSEPGVEFQPAISPDGKEAAFVAGPIGAPHLVIRSTTNAAGGGEIRLADTLLGREWFPAWSPDGDLVRFQGCGVHGCAWNEIGKLGGAVRPATVPSRAEARPLAWSPDGTRVAVSVFDTIFVASAADTVARRVAIHTVDFVGPLHSLAWSPDARLIAYVNNNPDWRFSGNVSASSIWIVSAAGGEPQRVTADDHLNVSPAWLDARHLLFVSDGDGERAVYAVTVGPRGARGEPRAIPGVADAHSISYSVASRRLAYAKFSVHQNIWSYPLGRSAPLSIRDGQPVTASTQVIELHDVSPDGTWIVYSGNLRGHMDLYMMPSSGGEPIRLTSGPAGGEAAHWSPDGREIVFHSVSVPNQVMVTRAKGGPPIALTSASAFNAYPSWSPSGRQIAFVSTRTGRPALWLLTRDSVGGPWHDAVRLTDFVCVYPRWAPDGSAVACLAEPDDILLLVSPQSGKVLRRDLTTANRLTQLDMPVYSRDGRTIPVRVAGGESGRYRSRAARRVW
jgi:Tol biopolymer transport system component